MKKLLSLAAALESPQPPPEALPDALHDYLAEELFQSASEAARDDLVTLALLPRSDSPNQVVKRPVKDGLLASSGTAVTVPVIVPVAQKSPALLTM